MAQQPKYTGTIRIKSIPHGEAPKWVRQEWVGLKLPCSPFMVFEEEEKGVVSGQDKRSEKFVVDVPQQIALDLLHEKSPAAAAWWHKLGLPVEGECFCFREEEVDIIQGVKRQTLMVADDMETGVFELPGR